MSRALGSLAVLDSPQPLIRRAIERFCAFYRVNTEEFETPPSGFSSFNAFFTRQLKPGARPISEEANAIVSPADGTVQASGYLAPGSRLIIKGTPYTLESLLDDEKQAVRFESGAFVVIYLSPRDYHRVHAPVAGTVESLRYIGGTLFPVNEIGTRYVSDLFARNERVAIYQRDPHWGDVATVMVGALGVGSISVSFDASVVTNGKCSPGVRFYDQDSVQLTRGAELGTFHIGSTVILLINGKLPIKLPKRVGDTVRVGEPIARISDA